MDNLALVKLHDNGLGSDGSSSLGVIIPPPLALAFYVKPLNRLSVQCLAHDDIRRISHNGVRSRVFWFQ